MLRLPGRKKKGKGEKKAETPSTSKEDVSLKATPAEGGMSSSTVPSVCVEEATHSRDKIKRPSDLAVAGQGQPSDAELETGLPVTKPIKHLKHVSTANSNLSDPGYSSQASMSTLGEGGLVPCRQRTGSTLSSVSNVSSGSYYTAMSGASPNSSGHVPSRFAVPVQDDVLKNILEKLTQLDKKMESHHESLSARVGDIEEKMKYLRQQTGTEGTNSRIVGSNTLPDLIEVKEEVDDKSSKGPSEKDQATNSRESRQRVYTDSEPERIAHAKKKRKEFSKRKCMSLQSSKLPNQACHQDIILWLANRVTEWKFIGRWLGLEETVLSRIETEHPKSVREQCYQMFLHWRSVDPDNFTYIVLGDALRKENLELFNEYVKEVLELPVNR